MTIYWSASAPGFYDTQYFPEDQLPADKVEVTPEDHAALMDAQAQGKVISTDSETGGPVAVDPPPPPEPSIEDQARAMLNAPVTVDCVSTPTLSADYANTAAIRQQATAVVAQVNAGLGLPSGAATFNWPDAAGGERQWPAPDFVAFANALAGFAYACQQVAGGFSATLPSTVLSVDGSALAGRFGG